MNQLSNAGKPGKAKRKSRLRKDLNPRARNKSLPRNSLPEAGFNLLENISPRCFNQHS